MLLSTPSRATEQVEECWFLGGCEQGVVLANPL